MFWARDMIMWEGECVKRGGRNQGDTRASYRSCIFSDGVENSAAICSCTA